MFDLERSIDQKFIDRELSEAKTEREHQDEIQEDTTSMEEKLEALDDSLSECCGAPYSNTRFCASCREHC